jgi:hypothetical protein
MDGRDFLAAAQHLLSLPQEVCWRSAANRLYLAVLLEARAALERWGFPLLPQDDIHDFVVSRFGSPLSLDLLRVEDGLRRLRSLATEADFALSAVGSFANAGPVSQHLVLAQVVIDLLDQIDNDPVRRAAAIRDIRARWP